MNIRHAGMEGQQPGRRGAGWCGETNRPHMGDGISSPSKH